MSTKSTNLDLDILGQNDPADLTTVSDNFQKIDAAFGEMHEGTQDHLWSDSDGVHVTDESREDWNDAVDDSFSDVSDQHPHHNMLVSSLGFVFRSALSTLVKITRLPSFIFGSGSATGEYSFSEGRGAVASGDDSHAQNTGTIAASDSQTAIGKYNVSDANDDNALIVGNGTADNARSNALTVKWNGNLTFYGKDIAHTHLDVVSPLMKRGENPTQNVWAGLQFCGSDNARLAFLEAHKNTSNGHMMTMYLLDDTSADGGYGGFRISKPHGTTGSNVMIFGVDSGWLEVPQAVRVSGRTQYNGSCIEFYPPANNSNYGGFIDFHFNQSSADYTSRIWENASGRITITGSESIWKEGSTNGLSVKSSNVNQASPSGEKWTCPTVLYDSAGNMIGHDEYYQNNAGTLGHNFAAVRQKVNGSWNWYQCQMLVQTNGTVTYGIHSAANFRSAIGAQASGNYAPHGWTQKATSSNDGVLTYSLSGCTEVMFAAMAGTSYVGSVILPVGLLHASTYREIYLSGGQTTASGGRGFAVKAITTRATIAARIQDGAIVGCSWWVYAR